MADKNIIKELLKKVKAVFDGTPPPPPPATPPPGTATTTPCSYNVDGGVPVFVDISSDGLPGIEANDKVYTDATLTTPYPDGTYNITGTQFSFTVAAGIVSIVNDATGTGPGTPVTAAAPPPATPPPPPPATPVTQTQMEAMAAKFGSGTSEDRLTNIETMLKSLMEYNFGYQIAQAGQAEAIVAYRDSIQGLQASVQKLSDLSVEDRLKKQDETIKGLFEIAEALVNEPTEAPKTLSGNKKEKFDRLEKKEEKFKGIIAGLKAASAAKKY